MKAKSLRKGFNSWFKLVLDTHCAEASKLAGLDVLHLTPGVSVGQTADPAEAEEYMSLYMST